MSPDSGFLNRAGIVDKVEAVRDSSGDVARLSVKIRTESEFRTVYYADQKHVDEVVISLPLDSGVNPGDVVSINMQFANPYGQRFQPALEAPEVEDDEVLEVMVEDGMVEEVKAGDKTECGDDGCTLDECQIDEESRFDDEG